MAFVRNETRSGHTVALGLPIPRYSRASRWLLVSGTATLLAFLSLATLAGLVFLAVSLASPSDFAPHAQKAATPDRLALAAFHARPAQRLCQSGCAPQMQYVVQQAKATRQEQARDPYLETASLAEETKKPRIERKPAPFNHARLASAFADAGDAPTVTKPPVPARFGPKAPEVERSSRLALALAGAGELQVAYALEPAPLDPATSVLARLQSDASADGAEETSTAFALVPQEAPLPARRPRIQQVPAAVAQAAPRQTGKPEKRTTEQQALAYASPDDGAPSVGQAFKNLFAAPGAGNGVAVYDISAQTVTMPDGSVLEAHSGIGRMADDPRYVNQKMNGPTPPNTYKLVMRESRFYGVEAIRMLPTEPGKMHGRNGILAHSYLLRGRTGQSHGCVAFADYDRFLKAFKQGKVKHMVVVPGRGKSSARIARNGRGA